MVISFGLLSIALHNSDDIVVQHPYQAGLEVGNVVEKARRAVAMHLWGRISATDGVVTLTLNPAPDEASVALHLEHPFDSSKDIAATLRRSAPGVYTARLPLVAVQYAAHVQTSAWSLSGRWKPGTQADLMPGVSQATGNAPQDE